ncbi:hypothetical protein Tsubulata_040626 [Turnera subulata]|uniref:Uncharacterized protein n=1 Tax=Turnera subulata TaxID=218843 RepID=A0A9Q0GKF1_9ROSI|nr:hypothetical protein Tsubulata_040626 [Turnera subulata]
MQLISAMDRHRPSTDHPIKFISRRLPHTLKFKIKPGVSNPQLLRTMVTDLRHSQGDTTEDQRLRLEINM